MHRSAKRICMVSTLKLGWVLTVGIIVSVQTAVTHLLHHTVFTKGCSWANIGHLASAIISIPIDSYHLALCWHSWSLDYHWLGFIMVTIGLFRAWRNHRYSTGVVYLDEWNEIGRGRELTEMGVLSKGWIKYEQGSFPISPYNNLLTERPSLSIPSPSKFISLVNVYDSLYCICGFSGNSPIVTILNYNQS